MKRMQMLVVLVSVASTAAVGCFRTRSEVAVKPVDINLNISGRLELVITDARKQEEEITGAKPKRTVRPEDIGLPSVPAPKSGTGGPGAMLPVAMGSSDCAGESGGDHQAALIRQMAGRHPQIDRMLGDGLVGESHTGFLVPKGSLSPGQQAVVDAQNADRAELYKLEAAKKRTTVDEAALGFYLARLEHVSKGTWVERYQKATGRWEWFRWDR